MAFKQDLRRLSKLARRALSSEEKLNREAKVLLQLRTEFDLRNKVVHTFLPIQRLQEIDTTPLLQDSDTHWALSQSNFETNSMTHVLFSSDLEIVNNDWDIPEPLGGQPLTPLDIDVVLVPLLTFDLKGYRVGYGKGFYDRFLAQLRPDCLSIGLSLFDPVTEIKDLNEFDKTLDAVVTPEIIYYF